MAGLQEEQVYLVLSGHCVGQIEKPLAGKKRESEQEETWGQAQGQIASAKPLEQRGQAFGWAGLTDLVSDQPPQPELPGRPVVELEATTISRVAGGPRADHVRAMEVVAVEEVRNAAGHGVPRCAWWRGNEGGQVRVVCDPVGDGQHRPHQPVDRPRILTGIGTLRVQDAAPQSARIGPDEIGRDPVTGAASRSTEVAGELEGQPPAHTVRGNRQPLGCHGIRRELGEHLGQAPGEWRGGVGRVQMHHRQGPYSGGVTS